MTKIFPLPNKLALDVKNTGYKFGGGDQTFKSIAPTLVQTQFFSVFQKINICNVFMLHWEVKMFSFHTGHFHVVTVFPTL